MIDVQAIMEQHTPAPERKWHRGQWRYDLCRRCKMVHPCPTHRLTLLVEGLRKAGITDYSKFTGTNRVDCHFCGAVWRTENSPKHKANCPLVELKEAD